MRTNTLLLTAALVAAGVATSMAQTVYSVNAVGYVNKVIAPGFNFIGNPLNGTPNNAISTIIPTAPDNTVVLQWNNAASGFDGLKTKTCFGNLWFFNDFSDASASAINPGEGFFIQNQGATSFTLTFVGEVPQGLGLIVPILTGFNMVSSIVPAAQPFSVSGFNAGAQDNVTYNTFDNGVGQYTSALTYLGGSWYDAGFNVVDPTPDVAQGFLIQNPLPNTVFNWTRSFQVSP